MARRQATARLTRKTTKPPNPLQRLFLAWAQRRVAKTTQTTLNIHNIYIF